MHHWVGLSWQSVGKRFFTRVFLMAVQKKTGCVLFIKRAGTKEQRGLIQFRKLWLNLLESRWLSLNFSWVRSFKPLGLQKLNTDFVLQVRMFGRLHFKMKQDVDKRASALVKFFQSVGKKRKFKIQWCRSFCGVYYRISGDKFKKLVMYFK